MTSRLLLPTHAPRKTLRGRSPFVREWLRLQKQVQGEAVHEQVCEGGNAVEVWRDVKGYEGFYKVSTLGNVMSVARVRKTKGGGTAPLKERLMALSAKKSNYRTRPYVEVKLRRNQSRNVKSKSFLVHRLVAEAFIKPLEKGDQVDHINGVHADNRVENLRVMNYVEHARIHPTIVNPCPRDAFGRFSKPV